MNAQTGTAILVIATAFMAIYIISLIVDSRRRKNEPYKVPAGAREIDPMDVYDDDLIPIIPMPKPGITTPSSKALSSLPLASNISSAPVIGHKTHTGQAGVVGTKRKYTKKKPTNTVAYKKDAQEFLKKMPETAPKASKFNGKTIIHEHDEGILAMSKNVGSGDNDWIPQGDDNVYHDSTPALADHSVTFGDGNFGGGGAGESYSSVDTSNSDSGSSNDGSNSD